MRHGGTEMNGGFGDMAILRLYLLGKLKDDVTLSRIELQLLSDSEFGDQLSIAENDLIEDYLDGQIDSVDTDSFQRHFLLTSERRQQVRLIQNLRKLSSEVGGELPQAKRGFDDWFPTISTQWLRFAALAVVLVLAGFGVWRFAIYQSDAEKGMSELRAAYRGHRPIEPRVTAFPEYSPFTQTRGPAAAAVDQAARERAQRYLNDASRDPNDAGAHHALALLYLTEKKIDLALREFEIAVAAGPASAAIQADAGAGYLEIAKVAASEKDGARSLEFLDKALKHLDRAISIDPKMLEPRFNRALCLEALVSHEQAKAAWREYLKLDPSSKWADEAARHLRSLEAISNAESSAADLESEYLAAIRQGDDALAGRLLSGNRELIREKYLPQRLAISYLDDPGGRRPELMRALYYTGQLEMKLTGDPFANEIAHFYSTLSDDRIEILKLAQNDIRAGYQKCLDQQYAAALDSFRSALTGFERAGDMWEASLARYFVGYALINIDRAEASLAELTKVADRARSRGYLWLEATASYWVGGSYKNLKQLTKAKRSFEHALSLAEKIDDAYALQRNLLELSKISSFCGQRQGALGYLFRAMRESGRSVNGVRQRYRNHALGFEMLSAARLFNAAKPAALDAVAAADISGDQMWLSESRSHAGAAFLQTGEYEQARRWIDDAKAKAGAIGDDNMRQKMLAFSAMRAGDLERSAGNLTASERNYNEAVSFYDRSEMARNREEARRGLLSVLSALGRDAEMEARIPENIRITEEFREKILNEQERTGFFDTHESVYDIAAAFEHRRGNFERSYDYAEASSSRSLLDWLQKGTSTGSEIEDRNEFSFSDNAKPFGTAEIRERVPAGVQIVQYSVLDEKTLIWVVSRDKFTARTVLVGSTDLEEKVQTFLRAVLDRDDERANALGRGLYDLLIGPVSGDLDPGAEICLVPSKILFRLPFGAVVSPAGKPLLADFRIVYAPSSSVFLRSTENARKKPRSGDERLLAVGNPAFERTQFNDLPYLPDAETEVSQIAPLYAASRTLTGSNATKTAFFDSVANADVVHFAGHYVVAHEAPASSYLLLAKDGTGPDKSTVTNLELAGRKLPQAKLIVLAACSSGVETYTNGEGLIGLSRTFLAADVPLVVASQWSVDTAATSELMKRFHQIRRRELVSTTEALRRAQLEMSDDPTGRFHAPYYWAAFAVFGGHADF